MADKRLIFRDIACAVIESADGKYLLGRKDPSKGGVYTDCWHIPGGGVQEGESLEEALSRELMEEVGLDLMQAQVNLVDDKDGAIAEKTLESGERVKCHMKFFVFHVRLPKPAQQIRLALETDLTEASWFSTEELEDLKLVPAGRPLFERLGIFNVGS
jgi:ADP-ribose pyrophosphatase YjhB (NUDIX family)